MNKIDFTSDKFIFISKPDQYYIEGHPAQCEGDFSTWKPDSKIETGWGMFNGLTMVSYKGYNGELPRMDGDTSSFEEFNIYYNGLLINEMTYQDLQNLILSEKRDEKIESITINKY